ncbi:hypothetical protein ACS0TY_025405 [Phlomoides rotata]
MGSLGNHHHNNGGADIAADGVSVVVVPFPAQGHLNQMLQLSCQISSFGIAVHYVSSAIHNRQAKVRVNGLNPKDVAKIHFHDLPIPSFPSPAPIPSSGNKFPAHLQPAWDAAMSMRGPLGELMTSLSENNRRVVVIHDPLISSVVEDVASIPTAESYAFNCLSGYCQVKFVCEQIGKECPVQRLRELPSVESSISYGLHYFIALQTGGLIHKSGDLYNTCRLVEGEFLDILEREEFAGRKERSWAIGPLIPAKLGNKKIDDECIKFLDKQAPKSVIFVTFGTTTSLTDSEVEVLATGLERSNQKFIWVLRDADKANVFDGETRRVELPAGFESRVAGRGLVVRDWTPQPEILSHPSTGVFMTHCGWNSCIESITMGVPMAAWPMHSDQPTNAVLVTEILKVGLPVRKWGKSCGEVVEAATVEDVVRRLIASEEGGEIRKRVEKLAAVVRGATEKGGASRVEMESFIAHITRQD